MQGSSSRKRILVIIAGSMLVPVAVRAEWSALRPLPAAPAPPPPVADQQWPLNTIDPFVRAKLDDAGLSPASAVGRQTWIRRVTFDLVGLPPTPEDVRGFLEDPRPDAVAYSAVADRLLASPRYGERWGRHWLDVVRYADTDGFAIDGERPTLWRYRDYVIRALNEDRGMDRFIREQLAGDEIGAGSEGLVATGFYRLGPWEADNMVPQNRRQDFLNEITSAVGSAFLGLTIGCARCHDHKFDPIPQEDFYRLQAFFTPLDRTDVPARFTAAESITGFGRRRAEVDAELARRRSEFRSFRATLKEKLAAASGKPAGEITDKELDDAAGAGDSPLSDSDRKRHKELKMAVDDYKEAGHYAEVACTVKNPDDDKDAAATHVLLGGDVFNPGKRVQPGFLSSVQSWSDSVFEKVRQCDSSGDGRRPLLANWVASRHNPLTARVLVNRVWQYHFGQGLVLTSNDFGANGSGASHPELLDYLAGRFIEWGWRLKPLHRMLVLSRTYRLSTLHPNADACATVDTENRLLWRAHHRRLEAEAVRDSLLAVSGRLNYEQGGPGFFEALPDEMETKLPFFDWNASAEDQRLRRSVYMFQRRNLVHPLMESFDAADMTQSCERRKASVTAPQVLNLLNSKFTHEVSRQFARRLVREAGDVPQRQIERMFNLAYGRAPDEDEIDACARFLDDKVRTYRAEESEPRKTKDRAAPELAALSDLCLVVLNTNEFLYVD